MLFVCGVWAGPIQPWQRSQMAVVHQHIHHGNGLKQSDTQHCSFGLHPLLLCCTDTTATRSMSLSAAGALLHTRQHVLCWPDLHGPSHPSSVNRPPSLVTQMWSAGRWAQAAAITALAAHAPIPSYSSNWASPDPHLHNTQPSVRTAPKSPRCSESPDIQQWRCTLSGLHQYTAWAALPDLHHR